MVVDRVARHVGERGQRPRRVGARVLRVLRRAGHEDVRRVPHLAVPVDHRRAGVRSHDRAARDVRRLIHVDPVRVQRGRRERRLVGVHRAHDLAALLGDEGVELAIVLVEVERQPEQRLPPRVGVVGVEVHELVAVRQALALDVDVDVGVPPFGERLYERRAASRAHVGETHERGDGLALAERSVDL